MLSPRGYSVREQNRTRTEKAHLNSLIASDCCAHAMGLIQYAQIHQPGMIFFGSMYPPAR